MNEFKKEKKKKYTAPAAAVVAKYKQTQLSKTYTDSIAECFS